MSELTFLTEEQVFGDSQLDILKKYGTKCAITDFSILLGGSVSSDDYTIEGTSGKDRTGLWWTKSPHSGDVYVVHKGGGRNYLYHRERFCGIRPALPYSSISKLTSNNVREKNGILEVEYGEYPQTVVSKKFGIMLETLLEAISYSDKIKKTGKIYTINSYYCQSVIEYEYCGKKYIRFVGNHKGEGKMLSDGRIIQEGYPYWVAVEPIKWIVDEKTNIALSKKIIFSGREFGINAVRYEGNFKKTEIKEFLDTILAKDIIPSRLTENTREENKQIEVNKVDKKEQNAIESILNQAIEKITWLDDSNKYKVISGLQNILSQYKGNSNKESINDIMSRIKILISKLDSKSSNLVKAELEEIQRKCDESNKYVTEDGIKLTLYNEDYLIEELKKLEDKVEKLLDDKINSNRAEEILTKIDLLISSFTSGNLDTMLNQFKTLGILTDNIYQNYNNLSFSYQ